MSRKSMYLVLAVVSLMSLCLTACDPGGCDGKVVDGVCQGTFRQPSVDPKVEDARDKVYDKIQDLNKGVEKTVVEKTAPKVKESVDQSKDDPKNPFNAAGNALDEQSCKTRGGVWFAGVCNK